MAEFRVRLPDRSMKYELYDMKFVFWRKRKENYERKDSMRKWLQEISYVNHINCSFLKCFLLSISKLNYMYGAETNRWTDFR
jgi:hypothetical protein